MEKKGEKRPKLHQLKTPASDRIFSHKPEVSETRGQYSNKVNDKDESGKRCRHTGSASSKSSGSNTNSQE